MTTKTAEARSGPVGVPRLKRIILYLILFVLAAFYLLPVYLLIITGLKSFAEVSQTQMWALPSGLHFESFSKAWFGSPQEGFRGLGANFWNSMILVVPATILSAMLGSINGYILTKWRFKGDSLIFTLLLFGMFIPYQSILIPLVQVLSKIPWFGGTTLYGTLAGLIFVHVIYGLPITTLIFRNYYAAIPNELIEASRIDGATFFSIYRYILFPLSMPGFVVVMIWQFTSVWNDFLFAVTITGDPATQPITVGLNNLAGSYIVEWNVQMAGSLLAALPTLVVYILLGRYFMRGLLAGSLKG